MLDKFLPLQTSEFFRQSSFFYHLIGCFWHLFGQSLSHVILTSLTLQISCSCLPFTCTFLLQPKARHQICHNEVISSKSQKLSCIAVQRKLCNFELLKSSNTSTQNRLTMQELASIEGTQNPFLLVVMIRPSKDSCSLEGFKGQFNAVIRCFSSTSPAVSVLKLKVSNSDNSPLLIVHEFVNQSPNPYPCAYFLILKNRFFYIC